MQRRYRQTCHKSALVCNECVHSSLWRYCCSGNDVAVPHMDILQTSSIGYTMTQLMYKTQYRCRVQKHENNTLVTCIINTMHYVTCIKLYNEQSVNHRQLIVQATPSVTTLDDLILMRGLECDKYSCRWFRQHYYVYGRSRRLRYGAIYVLASYNR